MAATKISDDEIECMIMDWVYGEGHYYYIDYHAIAKEFEQHEINGWDLSRIWKTLGLSGKKLIERQPKVSKIYMLTDEGMRIMRKHGTYREYLRFCDRQDKKKEKAEDFDRRIKNIGILATLLISLCTLFVSVLPRKTDEQQKQIQGKIELFSEKMDSLTKVLSAISVAKDTNTNKK
jgi:hypothetical protein